MATRRRWLQFSLRTAFVVLTVFAIWLGVIVSRAREQRAAVVEIQKLGGLAYYDWFYQDTEGPPGPAWLRRLIGDDFFQDVEMVSFDSSPPADNTDIPGALPFLERLRKLRTIVVPAGTFKDTRDRLRTAMPKCEVWSPDV